MLRWLLIVGGCFIGLVALLVASPCIAIMLGRLARVIYPPRPPRVYLDTPEVKKARRKFLRARAAYRKLKRRKGQ